MQKGFLHITVSSAMGNLPVEGAEITVVDENGQLLHSLTTDANGDAPIVEIDAPDVSYTLDPNYTGMAYTPVYVSVKRQGFVPLENQPASVVATAEAVLPVVLQPADTAQVAASSYYRDWGC
ncbi:MAG: hypothetical protein FWE53_00260 [Firmicutes bacterium]|nr:hypothetical protein [Bacillota bacterium]